MWESLIGAGASLLGGILGSSGQQSANQQSMQFNAQQADLNRQWQERMSNTAYQRSMADMKAAGLNPILAYSQGGASTPSGGQASAKLENTMEHLGKGVTSAGGMAARNVELNQVKANTAQSVTTADLNTANKTLADANTIKTNQETVTSAAEARRKDAETAYTMEQMQNPQGLRDLWKAQAHSAKTQGDLNIEQRLNPTPLVRTGKTILEGVGEWLKPPSSPTSARDAYEKGKAAHDERMKTVKGWWDYVTK
ncbi:DNA pilot protein [Blackfly microvirus SF02]|uniref:DNA pilot protein n=1 Tax=Blackfly microvirus SF02 TaxID=2576452 RepID=A0A4P8PSD7_9VIRU|nr:DNA pilot protein [Blackfly microvirus SF02]